MIIINSLVWLYRGISQPTFVIKWAKIHFEILALQLKYIAIIPFSNWSIFTYLKCQVIIYDLLWNLEFHHRMDVAFGNKGYLPHVDVAQKRKKSLGRMEAVNAPKSIDLVLVGAGHAHAYVIKKLGMDPIPGVRVTVINESADTPYSGMLPGEIAGEYTREESHINVRNLCQFADAIFVKGLVTKIDRANKEVMVDSGCPALRYDILSIDIGSSPKLLSKRAVQGATIPVTPVKPISHFSETFEKFVGNVQCRKKKCIVGVVGGGAGGVDLIIAMHNRFSYMTSQVELVIFSSGNILQSHNKSAQKIVRESLIQKGITVKENFHVVKVVEDRVISDIGESFVVTDVFWCTNATCQSLLRDSGFACDEEGFMKVNLTLESTNTPGVFGAGDCCELVDDPCPKAGVFAVREGPVLSENIRQVVNDLQYSGSSTLALYKPQKTFLGIIGKGDLCLATKGEMAIKGEWLWNLKQWIDTKWLNSYNDLPDMSQEQPVVATPYSKLLHKSKMRCGGCGSKIGSSLLNRALKKAGLSTNSMDDCSVLSVPKGDYDIIQSVDFFKQMIRNPFTFGQIVAVHALSDIHAMGGKALSAQAICIIPFGEEKIVEQQLVQLLSGCLSVLEAEGCSLQGGHSAEGEAVSMGLTVTGICKKENILRKSGAQVGDKIILTKSIGTGIILAALMKQEAKCSWVDKVIESMVKSNCSAGKLLAEVATSCTDVTGFGFIGHLIEMLKASNAEAMINYRDISLFPGVETCTELNIQSSLFESNFRAARLVERERIIELKPVFKAIFDPQTSGGLLATVPPDMATEVVSQMKALGYMEAKIIGEIVQQGTLRKGKYVLVQ